MKNVTCSIFNPCWRVNLTAVIDNAFKNKYIVLRRVKVINYMLRSTLMEKGLSVKNVVISTAQNSVKIMVPREPIKYSALSLFHGGQSLVYSIPFDYEYIFQYFFGYSAYLSYVLSKYYFVND